MGLELGDNGKENGNLCTILGHRGIMERKQTLRVQVPNNHILTQNLYYNDYYPKPQYLIIGYLDPLGEATIQGL